MENEIKNNETLESLITEQNDLLRRNLKVSEEILQKTDYIRVYIKWQKVWGVAKVIIIIIPIVIGVVYLPPLIKDYIDQFSQLYK